ncbi:histidinol-phosphate transaminase [Brachybacterium sp. MASK1Z-5]|uniref:Histidinol-phosphate transaminase n=1 Tax=Brachybacterium halotolerans TaxID=2795215 RepID=A0ABS1BCY9_9MICO|nr:histidinol-phosphate transaminase [Brachybacterium halotolerans]MBK0332007.1 histidinol-phosphate transaminase [Brachybacterium halotolerans]
MPETPAENIRLRSALDALPAYVPGKPAADDGVRRFKVSSNESPFEPLPQVIEAVNRATLHANLYPDMGALDLREAIAAHHSTPRSAVGPENIALSTGSVAVSGDLVRALVDPGDEVVFAWRSFEAYPILVRSHGGVDVQVPLTPAFEHDLPAMAEAITERTRLVILCTPNNPTGPALTTAQIEDFLARVPDHVVVALDEAYREFVDPVRLADTARLFAEHGNVVLLRTFSKMQGIAGLRVGYAVAHPRLAAALGQVTVPFGASSIAQAAALATFDPDAAAELEHRAAWIREQRGRLEQVLAAQGWELPASQGNFVYFPLGERSAEFAAFADARGLVVRAYGTDGVRVTVGEREANDLLLAIAQEWREAQEG